MVLVEEMKKIRLKFIFLAVVLLSFSMFAGSIAAAPIKFKQVVQVINAKPGKAHTSSFSKLRLAGDFVDLNNGDEGDEDKKKKSSAPLPQDGRVITTTISEIDEDSACECAAIVIDKPGFPKWTLFGLGAVPLPFIKWGDDPTPTPTPTPTTATPTPTTATPTPQEPVPEPMTLLLFGTGLAGVGLAARKKFGRKSEGE